MREIRTYGSVRGAPSNGRPYRDPRPGAVPRGLLPVRSRAVVESAFAGEGLPGNHVSAYRRDPFYTAGVFLVPTITCR